MRAQNIYGCNRSVQIAVPLNDHVEQVRADKTRDQNNESYFQRHEVGKPNLLGQRAQR